MKEKGIESFHIGSALKSSVHEQPGYLGPPLNLSSDTHSPITLSLSDAATSSESKQNSLVTMNSASGFFTNSQNIVITGGTFILNIRADPAYASPQDKKTRDAEQVVATGRKIWKTLRRKGEAVWPPLLQAALFEALEKYQQEATDSRAQKSGRFTMRNRFISEYIYETTGKCRTPKQVGGRLQRLRDICKGDKGCQSDCSS